MAVSKAQKVTPAQVIVAHAPKFGLDPAAVIAYMLEESGNRWGALGDQGTSFGPFQAHIGGAAGNRSTAAASAWANSPQGIIQMLGMMSRTPAKGLKGPAAVRAIYQYFGKGTPTAVPKGLAQLSAAEKLAAIQGVSNTSSVPAGPQKASGGLTEASLPPAPAPQAPIVAADIAPLAAPTGAKPLAQLPGLPKIQQVQIMQGPSPVDKTPLPPVTVQHETQTAPKNPKTNEIIDLARHYLGTKYVYGGASPKTGFDCSGFVQWLYGQVGVNLPRTTFEQVNVGTAVNRQSLKAGDIVFFHTENDPRGAATHEGLMIDSTHFIQSPHTGDVIRISSINDPYYVAHYLTARRVTK